MTIAYRKTENAFKNGKSVDGFMDEDEKTNWGFLKIEDAMKGRVSQYEHVRKHLDTSNSLALQNLETIIYAQIRRFARGFNITRVSYYFIFCIFSDRAARRAYGRRCGKTAGGNTSRYYRHVFVWNYRQLVRWRETLTRFLIGLVMCLFGRIAARIHLSFFDKMFLKCRSLGIFHSQMRRN